MKSIQEHGFFLLSFKRHAYRKKTTKFSFDIKPVAEGERTVKPQVYVKVLRLACGHPNHFFNVQSKIVSFFSIKRVISSIILFSLIRACPVHHNEEIGQMGGIYKSIKTIAVYRSHTKSVYYTAR